MGSGWGDYLRHGEKIDQYTKVVPGDQSLFVVEPLKFWMMFVKLVNAGLSLGVAFRIRRLANYILNALFFYAYLCWGIFIGFDGILYVVAPNGEAGWLLANIMRDFGLLMTGIIPFCMVQVGFVVKEGEDIAMGQHRQRIVGSFIVSMACSFGQILTDRILVRKGLEIIEPAALPPEGQFTVSFDVIWMIKLMLGMPLEPGDYSGLLSFIFYVSFVVWYFFGCRLILTAQRRESGREKLRFTLLMLGVLMIPIGTLYFIIAPFLGVPPQFQWIVNLAGQVIWALSPLFVLSGMMMRVK